MTWYIMTGVDLETAKVPLIDRSPFIDFVMIRGVSKGDAYKYFDDLEKVITNRKRSPYSFYPSDQDPLTFRDVATWTPGHLSGDLCQQEREGCCRVIFPC